MRQGVGRGSPRVGGPMAFGSGSMPIHLPGTLRGEGNTSVDGQGRADNIIAGTRCQIDCRTGDVFLFTDALRGYRYPHGDLIFMVAREDVHVGLEGAGRDSRHDDAVLDELCRHQVCELNQAGFAGGVGVGFQRRQIDTIDRGDVDHFCRLVPWRLRA